MTPEQTQIAAKIVSTTELLNVLLAKAEAEGLKFFICYQSDNNDFITEEGKRKVQVDIKKNLLSRFSERVETTRVAEESLNRQPHYKFRFSAIRSKPQKLNHTSFYKKIAAFLRNLFDLNVEQKTEIRTDAKRWWMRSYEYSRQDYLDMR